MKIIFISAANNIHTIRWVNALTEKGNDVYLISLKDHKNIGQDKINKNIKIYYLPISGQKGYILNSFFINNIIGKIEPDIINVHYASGYGTLGRFIKNKAKLLNVWGSDVYDFPYEGKIKKWLLSGNLKSYYKIASTSYCMANQVRKILKKEIEIDVIPFGIESNIFFNKKKTSGKLIIGTVKTLKEKYGIKYLIEAFNLLLKFYYRTDKEVYNNLFLEIYGKGELEEELKNMTKNLKIENKVYFGGYIENKKVPEIINKMDIFCVTSLSESFGVAAVEAMACEKPVVVTDADGLKEVVDNNITGYVVPKKNAIEIYKKLKKLVENKKLREKLGKAGRKKVLIEYEWNKNVDEMINLYKKIKNEVINEYK